MSPFEQVVQKVAPQSRLLRTWQLGGGISVEMTALEIEHPDGQTGRIIVRRCGDGNPDHNLRITAREFRLLQVLQSAGLATPAPLHFDPSGEVFPGPYMVLEYIEGRLEFAPSNLAEYIDQLATSLAEIHNLDCTRLGLSFLPRQTAECTETLGNRPAEADSSLAEERIRNTLAAAGPPPQRNAPVLLHGDYWPGNVLWHDERLAAVIDWEDAKLGEPLVDLANSRLEFAWTFGLDATQAFTRHYQRLVDVDYAGLPYWDLCAALRLARLAGADLAQWAAFFLPYGRHDITEHSFREDYQSFVSQAFEMLATQ